MWIQAAFSIPSKSPSQIEFPDVNNKTGSLFITPYIDDVINKLSQLFRFVLFLSFLFFFFFKSHESPREEEEYHPRLV